MIINASYPAFDCTENLVVISFPMINQTSDK